MKMMYDPNDTPVSILRTLQLALCGHNTHVHTHTHTHTHPYTHRHQTTHMHTLTLPSNDSLHQHL